MIVQNIPSFAGGEMSPLVYYRSDLEKYRTGCRTLRNFTLTPYGSAKRRPGLSYTATAPGKTRLETFQISIEKTFVMEITATQIRFFKNDQIVQAPGGGDLTITTPYSNEDLFEIDIKQINNVAYFVHANYPPYKLTRFNDDVWTFAQVVWSYPPMNTENLDENLTLSTGRVGYVGETQTLTASDALFVPGHVGSYFQISHERPKDQFETKIVAEKSNNGKYSPEIWVQGVYRFSTGGTWGGTFTLEINKGKGAGWEQFAIYTSDKDANFDVERTQDEAVRMRIKYDQTLSPSGRSFALIDTAEPYIRGVVKVTQVNSDRIAAVEVFKPVQSGATAVWREGAWSDKNGYPKTICTHEQRLVFASTETRKQTIWASAVDDYENFEPGSNDDQSWTHTLLSGQANDIQWLVSEKALLCGSTGDEWVISSSKEDGVITPTNVRARRHSGNGSDDIAPILIDDATVFVQRGGSVVRKMSYSFEADGYNTADLTLLAEHITGDGIVSMALQSQPEQVIWAVTRDGRLIGLTLDEGQDVVGWHRHSTGTTDQFEDVTVRKVKGQDDQIWVVVKRTINGATVRYIERLKPDGFFLEDAWSLLYQDTYGMTPWTLYELPTTESDWQLIDNTWQVGDVVFFRKSTGGSYDSVIYGVPFVADYTDATNYQQVWYCAVSHDTDSSSDWYTSDNDNRPYLRAISGSNTDHEWHEVESWQNNGLAHSYQYDADGYDTDYVYNSATNKIYRCIQSHSSSSNDEPGVGSHTADYWVEVTDLGTPTPYSPSSPIYEIGDPDVQHNGFIWTPAQDKPARANNAPAAGVSEWDENFQTYALNDETVHNGLPYKCILAHTAASDREPGTGASWSTYWEVIQGQYTAGDIASEDGINYKAKSTHTPAASSRPGVGASWETYWERVTDEDSVDFYVDAGLTLLNPGTITEVTGLGHLEGETVQVYANGAVLAPRTVSSGAIQLNQEGDPTDYEHISVGISYESQLEPMALEVQMQNGTSVSREKQITELAVAVRDSYGMKVGTDANGPFDTVTFYNGENATPLLYSGIKEFKIDHDYEMDATFILKQDLPMPLHIQAIVCKFKTYGDKL